MKREYYLSSASKRNREGVNEKLIEISDLAIKITLIDFGIPSSGGLRTAEEQNKLYCDGKSKCDGYSKKSNHQSGDAIDFYAFVDGKASWNEDHLTLVAVAFLQAASILGYKVQWGGFWKFKDMPHIELID